MRVAINIEPAFRNPTGTGRYIVELVSHLLLLQSSIDYTFFSSKTHTDAPDFWSQVASSRLRRTALPLSHKACEALWLTLNWPPVNRYIGDHDIYHSMSGVGYPAKGGIYLATIHDLSFQFHPNWYPPRARLVWGIRQAREFRRADHFVAVSAYTKQDMIDKLRIPSERITVIPEGVSSAFRVLDPDIVRAITTKYVPKGRFFLVLGDLHPRKNSVRIVRAFARVREKSPEPLSLLFVGPPRFRVDRTMAEVQALKLVDAVQFLGYKPQEEIVVLMNGAASLLYTSLYEGFGLPILESMACDTPVITSCVTSMPEVAGDAALLVDPTSEEQIADAMVRILSDGPLRRRLVDRGRDRLRLFTWLASAQKLSRLYEELVCV